MQIYEEKMYMFKFPYESTELLIPVRANTKEEAAEKLKKVMVGIQTDLALEFPTMSPTAPAGAIISPDGSGIPPMVLELRIIELMTILGYSSFTDAIIKKLTKLENKPEHFTEIIKKLEALRDGKED